ncbi:beta-L-arabinofuranosidase domain-containing protein [Sphingobacterium siyangense]|uniref:beta-L-arabinofuranosidase domain-containing protein n=1 Tax=Sphingobacterium siyangense TaxID=459529 RepID=UPI003DA35A57
MKRKKNVTKIIFSVFLCLLVFYGKSQDKVVPTYDVELEGYINDRLVNSINNRILAQDVDRLVNVFDPKNRLETDMWQSEFWGKWFTSAVLAYKFKPSEQLFQTLEKAVYGLINNQTADGYIGNYKQESRLKQWDIWGTKYCLLGLLSFYELRKDPKVLRAAEKLANNLMDELKKSDNIIVTKGNYRGMAASSVLEPICQLYKNTKNDKYLKFAHSIVDQWSLNNGPQLIEKSAVDVAKRFDKPKVWYSWEQGQKAYEMMSCYEGLLELYRLTADDKFKQAVEATWENIQNTEINIAGSGASTEMWFGGKQLQNNPIHHFQEVCVTVTWIKLSLQLFRLTGEAKYAEAAEKSYYNALLGSLNLQGDKWAKYTPLNGQRLEGSEQCGMGLNCCEASGPRGLFLLPFYAVTKGNKSIQINYFIPGEYHVHVGKNLVTVKIETNYPKDGQVNIRIQGTKKQDLALEVRVPSWSRKNVLRVNNTPVLTGVSRDQYITAKETIVPGDEIALQVEMTGRMEEIGNDVKSYAIFRGPILLSRDQAFLKQVPMGIVLTPVLEKDNTIELTSMPTERGFWMEFTAKFIPESYAEQSAKPIEVTLCDYASAGNIKDHSLFQSWFPELLTKNK